MSNMITSKIILNTRPLHQSSHLTQLLEKKGVSVFQFPLFDIQPISFLPIKTDDIDIIIFSSANAVIHFFSKNHPSFSHQLIIAIGSATQQALYEMGVADVVMPSHFSSEGILQLSKLMDVKNKNVVIICGENPKPLLKNKLVERGARVAMIYCYRRVPIIYDLNIIFHTLSSIDTIICTSNAAFLQLLHLFQMPTHRQWLLKKTVCVISGEMKKNAIAAGFLSVIQADNPTDQAVVNAITL